MVLVVFTMGITSIWADEQDHYGRRLPKYEGGLAFGYFNLPEYPGSDETKQVYLPLPFFIYRGDVIRSDRDGGLRGRFLRGAAYEFDVSVGAAFPSNSEDNEARAGMPNLDWIGEFGPRLRIFLYRTPVVRLDFNLPVRHVFSTNFYSRWHGRGFVLNPEIRFRHKVLFMQNSSIHAGIEFTHATKELMDYLYTVEPSHATVDRPAYQAEAGPFSSAFSLSFLRSFHNDRVNLFTGFSNSIYKGAKNESSPLMKDKYTTSYFLGLSYSFISSEEMVAEVKR